MQLTMYVADYYAPCRRGGLSATLRSRVFQAGIKYFLSITTVRSVFKYFLYFVYFRYVLYFMYFVYFTYFKCFLSITTVSS